MLSHTRPNPTRTTGPTASRLVRPGALVALLAHDDDEHDVDLEGVVEIVQAEIIDSTTPSEEMAQARIDALLDAFLDEDGSLLVIPRTGPQLPDTPGSRQAVRRAMLSELRSNAWADGTLHNYGLGVSAWRAWCEDQDVPALPFDPVHVANHLIDYALAWGTDDAPPVDDDGNLLQAVAVATVENRLAALNKAAEFMGLPRPGDNHGVRELVRGLRRTFLTAPTHRKEALTFDRLERCLVAAGGARLVELRCRATQLLRARTAATTGQLAKLRWPDVQLEPDRVTLELAAAHRHGKPTTVEVVAHRTNKNLCLVTSLHDLRAAAHHADELLTSDTGKPLTRQAIHLAAPEQWHELPTMTDRQLAAVVPARSDISPMGARDQALLLTGFWCALRRSNLSALNWRDLTDYGTDGIEVILRRSKTDQEGKGARLWVPDAADGGMVFDPAQALRDWKALLTLLLGRAPEPSEPVFAQMNGAGTPLLDVRGRLCRLSGDGINDVAQRLAIAANLTTPPVAGTRNPYGAHSLRAGWVTEAAAAGFTIDEIMAVTLHRSPATVVVYIRMAEARKRGTSRRLLSVLSGAA